MRRPFVSFVSLLLVGMIACGDTSAPPPSAAPDGGTPAGEDLPDAQAGDEIDAGHAPDASSDADTDVEAGVEPDAGVDAGMDGGTDAGDPSSPTTIRIVAANLTSGTVQSYTPGHGARILKGLEADITLIQEFNYGQNAVDEIRTFVTETFGADYSYYREPGRQIPTGVISRYPIVTSGQWSDPQVSNRGFTYAKIDVPGPHPLWAVSVHLVTSGAGQRNAAATALVTELRKVVADGDYVVIGGNFNTDNRSESCMTTFAQMVKTSGPHPADASGNGNTNASRTKPYDWVLANQALAAHQIATVINSNTFANGLVFDSRVYTPIADVAPVQLGDSAATNMQHMAVVKDFRLP